MTQQHNTGPHLNPGFNSLVVMPPAGLCVQQRQLPEQSFSLAAAKKHSCIGRKHMGAHTPSLVAVTRTNMLGNWPIHSFNWEIMGREEE